MVRLKVLATLMTGLAAAGCTSAVTEPSPAVAAINEKCADTASTGDSYRYCVQLGLEGAGFARPDSGIDTSALALHAD